MKNCISFFATLFILSCSPSKTEHINHEFPSVDLSAKLDPVEDTSTNEEILPLNNPVFMYGSSFGNYFQAFYKIGDFNGLMKFTCKESIDEFGYNNIYQAYKKMQFGYTIKFKSLNPVGEDRWIMNYECMQFATKTMLRMMVKLENDTVKLVLKDLHSVFVE